MAELEEAAKCEGVIPPDNSSTEGNRKERRHRDALVVYMLFTLAPKCTMLKDRDYDVTPHIILILSFTCTPKCTRGWRRFARCSVHMGDCRRRVRGVL